MRRMWIKLGTACALACMIALVSHGAAQSATIPDYKPAAHVSGAITICGSPQMGNLLKLYEQGFLKLQPGVRFNDQLHSTLTAVAEVSSGQADIGLLGREIWPAEVQAFESVEGHPPTVVDVATGSFDVPKATFALMVFVPKANPLASVSVDQLERIFAVSDHPVRTWGDLGLTGEWASRTVHLYGFSIPNDKSRIFAQLVFRKGERWNPLLNEFTNAAGPDGADAGKLIVQAVASDPDAIGISNVHYATAAVKTLAIAAHDKVPIQPTRNSVADRSYPLTRAVYMVIDQVSAHPSSAPAVEFLRYVLSRQGQQSATEEGNYLPLTPGVAISQLQHLPR